MPGDELVQFDSNVARVCTNKARYTRSSKVCHGLNMICKTTFIRLFYGSKYGLLQSSTIKHNFYSINWTFTRFIYGSPTFVPVMLELSHIRVCFGIKLTRFEGLASQIFELSTEKV